MIPALLQSPLPPWTGLEMNRAHPISQDLRRLPSQKLAEGVHVVDFFCGVGCPVSTMARKANLKVKTLIVVDNNTKVHLSARGHVANKKLRYPHLLSVAAIQGFDTRLPHDIRVISNTQMANWRPDTDPLISLGRVFLVNHSQQLA